MLTIQDLKIRGTKNNSASTNSNEWRLPTIKEFKNILYPNKDLIPNLIKRNYYWSSSDNNDNAWFFGFGNGLASATNKTNAFRVRAIRDISPNSANSANSTIIGNLEVWNKDLGEMNWVDAKKAVQKLNKNNKYETGGNMDYYSDMDFDDESYNRENESKYYYNEPIKNINDLKQSKPFNQFVNIFKPLKNTINDNAKIDGLLYDLNNKDEYKYVLDYFIKNSFKGEGNKIWTIEKSLITGELFLSPIMVDKLPIGYIITQGKALINNGKFDVVKLGYGGKISKYAKKGFSATKKVVKKHTKKAIKTVKAKTKQGFGKAKSYLKSKI